MALEIKHSKLSLVTDGGNTDLVQPSDWNATHVITLATGKAVGRVSPGSGNAEEIAIREVLSAARTYYVRKDGNNANTGLADNAGGAFLTIQKAIDVVAGLDTSIYSVTIQVRTGTYVENLTLKQPSGAGTLLLTGDTTTPANVAIVPSSGNAIFGNGKAINWSVSGFRCDTPSGSGIFANNGATITVTGAMVYHQASFGHIFASRGGIINVNAAYSITAGANMHLYAEQGGSIIGGGFTVTLTGTQNYSFAFAYATHLALVFWYGGAFSGGTITGTRYNAIYNGVIDSFASGANFYPGSSAGTTSTGGQYR